MWLKEELSSIKPQAEGRAANANNSNNMLGQVWWCTSAIQPWEFLPGQKYGNSEATLGYMGQFKASLGCIVSPSENRTGQRIRKHRGRREIGRGIEEERGREGRGMR